MKKKVLLLLFVLFGAVGFGQIIFVHKKAISAKTIEIVGDKMYADGVLLIIYRVFEKDGVVLKYRPRLIRDFGGMVSSFTTARIVVSGVKASFAIEYNDGYRASLSKFVDTTGIMVLSERDILPLYSQNYLKKVIVGDVVFEYEGVDKWKVYIEK